MAGHVVAQPSAMNPQAQFLGFQSDPKHSVGVNVALYFELWEQADGGGLTEYGAARRLIDHLPPDWTQWAHELLEDMTEEDFYTYRYTDFPLFVQRILTHYVNAIAELRPPRHPQPPPFAHALAPNPAALAPPPSPPPNLPMQPHPPVPYSPPPAPYHPLPVAVPQPPPLAMYHTPPPSPPPAAYHQSPSPSPYVPQPVLAPWDLAPPFNAPPVAQPPLEYPWGLESIPHGHYYYLPDPFPLPVYPAPNPPSPPLPGAPPNSPRTPLEFKPVSSSSVGSSTIFSDEPEQANITEYALF